MDKNNLADNLFSKRHTYEACILCSYGLGLHFFENYLMNLEGLYSCEQITVFTDYMTYEGFMQGGYQPRWLNRKYLVIPLQTTGVFHSKLYMLASESKATIAVGSANLTRGGIASNLELLSYFEISEQNTTYAVLLQRCLDYARQLGHLSNSKVAIDQIDTFTRICHRFLKAGQDVEPLFVHNLETPVLPTLIQHVQEQDIDKVQILSPFFDRQLAPLQVLRKAFPGADIEIYVQQHKSNFPVDTQKELIGNSTLRMYVYHAIERYMHGKAILFHAKDKIWLFTGSANFTRPALLKTASTGNYEIGLLGTIDKETAIAILSPAETTAKQEASIQAIKVDNRQEFPPKHPIIHYILEAILEDNQIRMFVNTEIPVQEFQPRTIRLSDNTGHLHEEPFNHNLRLVVDKGVRKRVPGKIAVQILGVDQQGQRRESNISWIIELEQRREDSLKKKFRRIYLDPFELINVMNEIASEGSQAELLLFLQTFDIPLDLILPPRKGHWPRRRDTKGNIEGKWPSTDAFDQGLLEGYRGCFERLCTKLQRHLKNPQPERIPNFVLIFNSLLSMANFMSERIAETYKNTRPISSDDWSNIREYFNLIFQYIGETWRLTWSQRGYRNAINAMLARVDTEEKGEEVPLQAFRHYILSEYNNSADEFITFAYEPLRTFEELLHTLRLRTIYGQIIGVKVFSADHMHIQVGAREEMERRIKNVAGIIQ